MKKLITLILVFLTFSLVAQKDTISNGIVSRYSIAPTAFTLDKGQVDVSLHGPFLNKTFFNIENNFMNSVPSNFYSMSIGINDYLTTSVGVSPLLMIYSGVYRYLPIYNNTKVGFELYDGIYISGGVFTFNLPTEILSANYKVWNYWDVLPQPSRDSSFIVIPYLTMTFGNENNNLSVNYSTNSVFILSGKLKLSNKSYIMSENFFINSENINSGMFGFLIGEKAQANIGIMYLSPLSNREGIYPLIPSYSFSTIF